MIKQKCDINKIVFYHDRIMSSKEKIKFERHLSKCSFCLNTLKGLNEDLYRFKRATLTKIKPDTQKVKFHIKKKGIKITENRLSFPVMPLYIREAAGIDMNKKNPAGWKIFLPDARIFIKNKKNTASFEIIPLKKIKVEVRFNRKIFALSESEKSLFFEEIKKGTYKISIRDYILKISFF